MPPQLAALLSAQGGVAAASQLSALGITRYVLRRLVARKVLVRLPRGILVDPSVWHEAPSWDRHALRARGLMLGSAGAVDSPVALSHHSALSVLGVATHGVDDRVHIVRTDGKRGRTDEFIQCHAPVLATQIQPVEDVRMTLPEVAVLQTAATFGVEAGLVSADSCLRLNLVVPDRLQGALGAHALGNGRSSAALVVEHASALAESAGESRCRWIFTVLNLPRPREQAVIRDSLGQFVARVDFLFEDERTIVEFDGRVKYTDQQVLFDEKKREDALRALGYSVVRIVWADLAHPDRVRAKILAGFKQARLLGAR